MRGFILRNIGAVGLHAATRAEDSDFIADLFDMGWRSVAVMNGKAVA